MARLPSATVQRGKSLPWRPCSPRWHPPHLRQPPRPCRCFSGRFPAKFLWRIRRKAPFTSLLWARSRPMRASISRAARGKLSARRPMARSWRFTLLPSMAMCWKLRTWTAWLRAMAAFPPQPWRKAAIACARGRPLARWAMPLRRKPSWSALAFRGAGKWLWGRSTGLASQ